MMSIENLYAMINELNISDEEKRKLFLLFRRAVWCYLESIEAGKTKEQIDFELFDEWINQNEFLNQLGIKVEPVEWEKRSTSNFTPDFGPTYHMDYRIKKFKTIVTCPTSLFELEQAFTLLHIVRNQEEFNINRAEKARLYLILKEASWKYLELLEDGEVPETFDIELIDVGVKQTALLTVLGLKTNAVTWQEEEIFEYTDPIDDCLCYDRYKINKVKTIITIPTSLLTPENKSSVLKMVREKNKKN